MVEINLIWSKKNSADTLDKLNLSFSKLLVLLHTIFSTLYIRLTQNLFKHQFLDLNERRNLYLTGIAVRTFSTSEERNKKYNLRTCQKVTETLVYLLDKICIRFAFKLCRNSDGNK